MLVSVKQYLHGGNELLLNFLHFRVAGFLLLQMSRRNGLTGHGKVSLDDVLRQPRNQFVDSSSRLSLRLGPADFLTVRYWKHVCGPELRLPMLSS
jgi:hypothetical protein